MQYGKNTIDKYLADAGFGSRKDVKGLLKAKQVTINGETCVMRRKSWNRRRMLSVCRVKWSCMRVFLIICCINHRGSCLQRKMHMKKQL